MILVLTTADTEILALRSVIEALPAGFPSVRAANPAWQALTAHIRFAERDAEEVNLREAILESEGLPRPRLAPEY